MQAWIKCCMHVHLYMYVQIQREKNGHALIYTLFSGYIYINTVVCEAQNDLTQLETLLNTLNMC